MSRSGYSENIDSWALIKWRGQVASATRGKRGQKLLTDLLAALDAMHPKALIAHELESFNPEAGRLDVCALGALGQARGLDMSQIDPGEPEDVAVAFDIAPQLAREIVYANDEGFVTPEDRWTGMRKWVAGRITKGAVKS